jgi:hypothetical protein
LILSLQRLSLGTFVIIPAGVPNVKRFIEISRQVFRLFSLLFFARVYLAHMRHFAERASPKGITKGSAGERKKKTALPV